MNNSDPTIIFHRSKNNSEEDLTNQQAFLKANPYILNSVHIVDYMTSGYFDACKAFEVFENIDISKKVIVIMNSFLSKKEYDAQYNLHHYFQAFKSMGIVSMYLMDSAGRLYKEVETIEEIL